MRSAQGSGSRCSLLFEFQGARFKDLRGGSGDLAYKWVVSGIESPEDWSYLTCDR